jgi:hypothetical protein
VLIDEFLPNYDVVEHHEVDVDAPVDVAYRAVRNFDLARSPVVLALLFVRGMPRMFTGGGPAVTEARLDQLLETGFVVLEEQPGRELVLGVVGKFWRPTSGFRRIEPGEFVGFDAPGFAKAGWNFVVSERPGRRSTVVTETRVLCTDDDARRRFSRYWWLIGRFSALIRRIMLREIKRDAESRDVVT